MKKIMFVCHGNICRSPMAEFVLKKMLKDNGVSDVVVNSSATSYEEIGNGVHIGTKKILDKLGIDCSDKRAVRFTMDDYDEYDMIVVMDDNNVYNLSRIIGEDTEHKVIKLLDLVGIDRDVADPWYTGDFEKTCQDITLGCLALLDKLKRKA